jgi:hypothetical protein
VGLSVRTKFTLTVFTSAALHAPPPPVHADAGRVSTGVCAVVEAVWEPEQAPPYVAPEQVCASPPPVAEGPPAGAKSDVTRRVIEPPGPVGAVRTQYLMGSVA